MIEKAVSPEWMPGEPASYSASSRRARRARVASDVLLSIWFGL